MPKFRAIILDLDDTLYPERDYVLSGFRAVARWLEPQLNLPAEQTSEELKQLFDEGARINTFNTWLSTRKIDAEQAEQWVSGMLDIYRSHTPEISLSTEVVNVLEQLRRDSMLGLITDGRRQQQRKKVDALDLARWFTAIVVSDELGQEHWKPSPKPYLTVLEQLNITAKEAIYVADNPTKDFLGARRVGMASLRLRCDGRLHCRVEPPTPDHAPDAEIERFGELPAYLNCPSQNGAHSEHSAINGHQNLRSE